MRIADLTRDLSRLYGFTDEQIRIAFTGLRPGENLCEDLLANDETATRTPHRKPRMEQAREVPNQFLDELLPWLMQHHVLADDEMRRDPSRWVPEHQTTMPPVLTSVRNPTLHSGAAR